MSLDYERDISIDPEALDVEWLSQPSLVLKYSQHSATMRKKLDEKKQELDIAKAEADKKIRTNPSKYGIEKITEGAVTAAILTEEDYREAYTEYLNAKYEADMASAAVSAFEHRKSALENLVRLFGQQYFAGPKMPHELGIEWEAREKERLADKKVKEGMQRLRNK